MCGRYTLHSNKKKLAEAIALAIPESYEPDYNIGPGRPVLALAGSEETKAACGMMHWGLRTPQNFHINARLETADNTPRFRESWAEHRCLLPANGFYEWYQDGITKQPYYLFPETKGLTYFAGLWFPAAFDGAPATCVILTTEAHPSVKPIHDRMPAMLPHEAQAEWLSGTLKKREALALSSDVALQKHTISRRVNSVQNKDSHLIEATSPLADDQMMLF
jgi:putative SOS response-associated peptidase YedK